MQRRGKTFIVSGPSGVGKSTVLKALFDQRTDLYFSISATTRDPRPGEVDGVHYHFIPAEEFHRMVEEDEFLEYAEYVGNFYGTPKKYVDRAMDDGRDVILENKLTEYIPNRYMLVNVVARNEQADARQMAVVARRARQIAEEAEATGQHLDEKPVTLAIHEVAEGKFDAHTIDTEIEED